MRIRVRQIDDLQGSIETGFWDTKVCDFVGRMPSAYDITAKMVVDYLEKYPFPENVDFDEKDFLDALEGNMGTFLISTNNAEIVLYTQRMLEIFINPPSGEELPSPLIQNSEISSPSTEGKCGECYYFDPPCCLHPTNQRDDADNRDAESLCAIGGFLSNQPACEICVHSSADMVCECEESENLGKTMEFTGKCEKWESA